MKKLIKSYWRVPVIVVLVLIVLFSFCKPRMPWAVYPEYVLNGTVSVTLAEPGFRYCANIWEYLEFVMTYDLPFGFVSWEQVAMLGAIQSATFRGDPDRSSCRIEYVYIDSTGSRNCLYFDYGGYSTRFDISLDKIGDHNIVDLSAIVFETEKAYEENALCVRLFSEDEATVKAARTELYLKLALGKVISILINLVLMAIPVGLISTIVIRIYEKKKKKVAAAAPAEDPAQ